VSTLRFKKKAKLIKTDEFSSVFNFRKRIFANFLAFHYEPNHLGLSRLGLVVSKKVAKHAVDRNYMRRVLREFFRLQQHAINHIDLVVRVQKRFEKKDFIQIKQEFDLLMMKVNQRTQLLESRLTKPVTDNHVIADIISDDIK
jgi:ribonuclease P protein component